VLDRWIDSYRWLLAVLTGLLLLAAFAPFSCATCGWIALVPAWWMITRCERVRRRPLRYGYLIGLIYFGGVFWWISNVAGAGVLALIAYLALYPALWFLFAARMLPVGDSTSTLAALGRALGAAALWVTLEWWRSWFLTGFNWNELGISQSTSTVYRQIAAYGGVHLISFVLVAANVLWAEGLLQIIDEAKARRPVRASGPFAAALLLAAGTFALGWHHLRRHSGETPAAPVTFACIQSNLPPSPFDRSKQPSDREILDRTEELTLHAIHAPVVPDLLIWPEALISEGVFEDVPLTRAVREIGDAYPGYFLLGAQDFDIHAGRKLYNVADFFSPHTDSFTEYRKMHLVILGEFLPLGDTFPILREWTGIGLDFTPGTSPQVFVMDHPPLRITPLICFEDSVPEIADAAIALRPDCFITITNDGWYTGWTAAWGVRQHLAHAVFRCVEHDRPMIRCANTGVSCLIDENGMITSRLLGPGGAEIDVGGVFTGAVAVYPVHMTLYERWGDWIVLISGLVSGMLGVWFFLRADES
jgi:apolipoprotein N-acyltransferase